MVDFFINLRNEFLDPNVLYANIIACIALFFICISYQSPTKKRYLLFQIISNIFYFAQYFLLNAISACLMNILQILKSICFYLYENGKLKINKNIILGIFTVLPIIIGFFTYTTPISLIPIILSIIYTVAMWVDQLVVTYSISSICPIVWIFYNFTFKAYVAGCGSIVEFLFAAIGLVRSIFRARKLKKLKKERKNKREKISKSK